MSKRINLLLICCLALLGFVPSATLAADFSWENVEIAIDFQPFKEIYINDLDWLELEVQISNQNPGALTGELQVTRSSLHQHGEKLAAQELNVASGSSKVYRFTLPSHVWQQDVYIKMVTVDQQEEIIPIENVNSIHGAVQTVILSVQENDFTILRSLDNEYFRRANLVYLSPQELPQESWLHQQKILAIGDLGLSVISAEQKQALVDWVRSGGVLLLSGNPSLVAHSHNFRELLPFEQMEIRQEKIHGKKKEGVLLFPDQESPLFAVRSLGSGLVIMSTFDVQAEQMLTWSGYKDLWEEVLAKSGVYYTLKKAELYQSEQYRLPYLSERIPHLDAPSVSKVMWIWFVYLLLIGPFLYLFLKKLDKREWAWFIIPSLVLITAVSLYLFGIKSIANHSGSHTASIVHLHDQHLAKVESIATFFVVEGGSYQVEVPQEFQVTPYVNQNNRNADGSMKSYLQLTDEQTRISYEHVPYMSITKAKASGTLTNLGEFVAQLEVHGDRLQGTLTNQTGLDVEEVELLIGYQSYPLGNLAQGEEKKVDITLSKLFYPSPEENQRVNYEERYYQQAFFETRNNLYYQILPSFYASALPKVDIWAVSKSPLPLLSVENKSLDNYYTTMLHQEVTFGVQGEQVIFPYGTLPVFYAEEELKDFSPYGRVTTNQQAIKIQVSPGIIQPKRIEIPLNETVFRPFAIKLWNWQSKAWEEIEQAKALIIEQEQMERYVNKEGVVKLLFDNQLADPVQLPFPYVQVEGEITP